LKAASSGKAPKPRGAWWVSRNGESPKKAALQERLEELHKKEEKTRHKLEDTGVVLQDFCKTRGICDGA
jgi:hypothetical protein